MKLVVEGGLILNKRQFEIKNGRGQSVRIHEKASDPDGFPNLIDLVTFSLDVDLLALSDDARWDATFELQTNAERVDKRDKVSLVVKSYKVHKSKD